MATVQKSSVNNALPPKVHFYRRVLPDSCISFSSDEGKRIFKEALGSGHMECYFRLAAQFRTQDEPAFCGLSTMVMVLNALDIDPGRIWKGPWRWYHENMLDCCVPLEVVEQKGISFDQFLCVASCNSLLVNPTRMVEGAMSIEEFRDIVAEYTQKDNMFVILSYSRKVVGQTGDGHYSPVGGYHPGRDLILVLDTARFKYPPHWVPLQLIYEAMKALDMDTGKPRGVMLMSRRKKSQQLLLFRLASNMSLTTPGLFSPGIREFMLKWTEFLKNTPDEEMSTDQLAVKAATGITDHLSETENSVIIMTTQLDTSTCCPDDLAKEHECVIYRLIKNLEKTLIFEKVSEILNSLSPKKKKRIKDLFGSLGTCCSRKCRMYNKIDYSHFLAILILSWPYSLYPSGEATLGVLFAKMVASQLQGDDESDDILMGEVTALQDQLGVLVDVCIKKSEGPATCCKNKKLKSESCHSQM